MDPATQSLLNLIIGPVGALVLAIGVIWWLLAAKRAADAKADAAQAAYVALLQSLVTDRTAERDLALSGWSSQTDATNRLADTIEADRTDRAVRSRRADRGAT
jgi:hypothetical protein